MPCLDRLASRQARDHRRCAAWAACAACAACAAHRTGWRARLPNVDVAAVRAVARYDPTRARPGDAAAGRVRRQQARTSLPLALRALVIVVAILRTNVASTRRRRRDSVLPAIALIPIRDVIAAAHQFTPLVVTQWVARDTHTWRTGPAALLGAEQRHIPAIRVAVTDAPATTARADVTTLSSEHAAATRIAATTSVAAAGARARTAITANAGIPGSISSGRHTGDVSRARRSARKYGDFPGIAGHDADSGGQAEPARDEAQGQRRSSGCCSDDGATTELPNESARPARPIGRTLDGSKNAALPGDVVT